MGFLAKHLAVYRELFSPNQVHAILFDDICSQPVAVVQSLYKFLGVGAEFQPAQGRGMVNESTVIRSRGLASVARSVVRGIKAVRLGWLAENAFVMSLYRRINKKRPPPLDADMWAHLWELYRDDVHSLGNLLDRDLEAWGRPPATEGMA